MNILVTGANGQLGNEMRIISKGSADKYIFTDVSQVEGLETIYLDITDLDAIRKMVVENGVKAIVNCAAWTNVDACENDEKLAALAEKLNAEAPKNLAIAMKEVGGVLFHVSTDYVFGKEPYNTPCKPDQQGTPTGVYGATKKHGEENILASGCDYIILRTAWLYSEFGKNFCKTMLNLTATKPTLKVVYDQCGTPTYAYDLAAAIYDIIANRKFKGNTGVYHYSNEGVTSWYDFTQMIARIAGNRDCDIQPCYSSEYPSPVTRPSYSVLDKKSFKETFGLSIPYWVDSLEVCIKNLQK
ncbi:MAG: dTDP-4-dehydrorhamnose reductase [Paludibacteraceae bacterium]|nr:dTDP-4-dehydrorhamnose reductase [Paludibacteraceae bacterium]